MDFWLTQDFEHTAFEPTAFLLENILTYSMFLKLQHNF